jgi:hypothetical protein
MMDLNPARRRRERAIAQEVAEELMREIKSTQGGAPPELLAHHFALVCQRLTFLPGEAEARRVLRYASKEIARRRREADRLVGAVLN